MKRLFHIFTGFAFVALACMPAASSAADINIKVATTVSTKHAWIKVLEVLQAETDKRVPGKVNYEVFLGAQLGKDPVVLAGVQSGTHMMTMQASSPASIIPEYTLFDAPFMFSSREQVKRIIAAVQDDIKAAALNKGIIVTGIGELGFRQISNNVRPIVKPADLEGVKLRTPDNPFRITIFKHFGANPTPMSFTEVYVALRTGVIDGQENPLSSINSGKFYEVQKYISLSNHVFTPTIIMISKLHWDGWPSDVQTAILEASEVAMAFSHEQSAANESKLRAGMEGHSAFNDIDAAAFREASKPLYAEIEKKVGKDLWAKVLAAAQ
jgi:tripartite ATP-independent transporter DctP family solute receptor